MEINGLSVAQAETAMDWVRGLDGSGIAALSMEHTPGAGNPNISQNVLRISVAGPSIGAFVQRVRDKVQAQLGQPLDLDENRSGDLQAIQDAWQLHGPNIANRPALKAALVAIWKNGARCMGAEDTRTLNGWLKNKGFSNRQELRAWLNQTP
jgi:hypothetical protein